MNDNKAEDLFLEADQLTDNDKYIEAKEVLLDLLKEYPDYGRAHSLLGWMYQDKFSNNDKAKFHYKLSMKYAPTYSSGYNNYAYLLVETNEYDEMLSFGEKHINNKAVDKATIYNKMGQASELKGELIKAFEYYKLSIKDTLNIQSLESLYASINRVKSKMNILERIKILSK